MEPEIFRVEVNEEGIALIKRFRSMAILVLIFGVAVSATHLLITLPPIIEEIKNSATPQTVLRNQIYVSYNVVMFCLHVVQVIFYLSFATQAKNAFNTGNGTAFNRSFKWLIYQSAFFLLQTLLVSAYMIFNQVNTDN